MATIFYLCTLGCDDDEDGASRLWGVCVYRSRIKGLNTRESTSVSGIFVESE